MEDRDLDALVVRAPDNVLYLTNFWGMKGYDACVFPREGEPVLDLPRGLGGGRGPHGLDAGRAPVQGLRRRRSAPADARASSTSRARRRTRYGRIGLELSLGTQASDRMVGEPTTYTADWFGGVRRRGRRDASPRRGACAQDRAGGRAHAARERDRRRCDGALQARHRAGHERGADRGGVGGVRPRRGHRLGGEGGARARLLARLVGAGDQDVHGHDVAARGRGRADALRDLGLRRRLLVRPHEEPRSPASSLRATASSRPGCWACTRTPSPSHGRARASPSSTAGPRRDRRDRLPRSAVAPDLPRRRRARARAAVRAPGRRRRGRRGHGACNRARMLYRRAAGPARRGQLPRSRTDGAEKLSPFPDGIVAAQAADAQVAARAGSCRRRSAAPRPGGTSVRSSSSRSSRG